MALRFERLEERDLLTANLTAIDTSGTNNVVIADQVVFAAAGSQGLLVLDVDSLEVAGRVPPPSGSNTIDDVALAEDLLFALDGSRPGNLSVFSIENPVQPTLVAGPIAVDVGPFAGVSAAAGRVVVSGGTGRVNILSFDSAGQLSREVSRIDLGVGQPDVLIANDGNTAFVSTDFSGTVDGETFGVTVIDVPQPSNPVTILDRVGIAGAGFSPGFRSPANFPVELAQQENNLFVASRNGISVFDVSNRQDVRQLTEIALNTNPVNIDVVDDHLFVVSNSPVPTLTVIDIADLNTPILQTFELPADGDPLGIAASDEHVVVADAEFGVLVASTAALTTANNTKPVAPPTSQLLVGDLDGDGSVAFSDFLILSTNFGRTVENGQDGDIDGSGTIDFADFLLLSAEFGVTT